MAKHQVDIILQGYDRASKEIGSVNNAIDLLGKRIGGMAAAYGIYEFVKESVKEYAQFEQTMLRVAGALGIEGAAGAKKYAGELEKLTGIHDELILKTMGLGAMLGHLSGEQLNKATEAAIGWATILGISALTLRDRQRGQEHLISIVAGMASGP